MAASRLFTHVIQRYYPFRGGSERYFQAFSERFVRTGARVQVVTSDAWDLEYFWDPHRRRIDEPSACYHGVAIQRVRVGHLPLANLSHRALRRLMAESSRVRFPMQARLLSAGSRFGPWLPGLFDELARLERPDLVNSANVAFESMIATTERFAHAIDIPHVVTPFLHLGESEASKVRRYYTMPQQIELLRRADALLVLTETEADYLLSRAVEERKIHVVGAGIDVDAVTGGDAAAARQRLRIDGPIVLSLGAAAFDKGTTHLIEAAKRMLLDGHNLHLVIAGPVLSEIERYVTTLDHEDLRRVHLLGFVSDDDRRDLLAAADVLALPSRTESFGLVFMEAWANCKPVVGARAGAIPAIVSDQVDGLLVEFGDVAGLADALRSIIRSPHDAAEMGLRGRAKVVSEDQWFERVRAVYDDVLGTHAGSRLKET